MRSPADMTTIQIDITNACNKRCSNCTRFCGNHKKNFFMDYETFTRAVDSLDGFQGITGVMGGEPTLHPEFDRFVEFIQKKFANVKKNKRLILPQKNFIKEIRRSEFDAHRLISRTDNKEKFKMVGPGLWSNMGATYYNKYELIQDTFSVQFLNDHINPSNHQPGLVSRKDLGIPDEQWIPMRDNCWVQNEWSASITPKGAFFCEIAAALDMLFDGPGGWPIEPGWWKRKPEEFGDQLHWCEICGFALDTFMRDAEEEIDDVSDTLYNMLQKIDSPRLKSGKVNLIKLDNGQIAEECKANGKYYDPAQPYIEHYEDRFNINNSVLFINNYEVYEINPDLSFGDSLNEIITGAKEWVCIKTGTSFNKESVDSLIKNNILNPGTLHIGEGYILFSKKANSLKQIGYDRIRLLSSYDEFAGMWQTNKVVDLSTVNEMSKWKKESIVSGKRYAIWGTGLSGDFIADIITGSQGIISFAIDIDSSKQGKMFWNTAINSPEYLKEHDDDFDFLIIGHYSLYNEICSSAMEIGISRDRIILPYELQ